MENYKINFEKQTFTITKDFVERARNINSEEYNILMKVKKDFPNMKVLNYSHRSPKKANKNKGLNYARMEQYIKLFDNAEELLAKFTAAKEMGKHQKNSYLYVNKWFLETFPDFFELPNEENGKLHVVLPLHTVDNKKHEQGISTAIELHGAAEIETANTLLESAIGF